MSKGQWTVFGLLAAILGLELAFSPNTRNLLRRVGVGGLGKQEQTQQGDWTLVIFWAIGAAALLTLADFAPRAAEILAAILLVSVLFARQDPVLTWLTDATNWLSAQRAAASNGSTSAPPASSSGAGGSGSNRK